MRCCSSGCCRGRDRRRGSRCPCRRDVVASGEPPASTCWHDVGRRSRWSGRAPVVQSGPLEIPPPAWKEADRRAGRAAGSAAARVSAAGDRLPRPVRVAPFCVGHQRTTQLLRACPGREHGKPSVREPQPETPAPDSGVHGRAAVQVPSVAGAASATEGIAAKEREERVERRRREVPARAPSALLERLDARTSQPAALCRCRGSRSALARAEA